MKRAIERALLSEAALALLESLRRSDEWEFGEYSDMNKSGLQMWSGNGGWFYDAHNSGSILGCLERHYVWRQRQKSSGKKIVSLLSNGGGK